MVPDLMGKDPVSKATKTVAGMLGRKADMLPRKEEFRTTPSNNSRTECPRCTTPSRSMASDMRSRPRPDTPFLSKVG